MRVKHWEQKFAEQIKAAQVKPFEWGTFDCCMFAADAVLALTGVDLAADFRGKYSDEAGAQAFIATYGDLAALVSAKTADKDMAEINLKFAQRGDLVLVNNADRQTLGLVGLDSRFVLCTTKLGLVSIPMSHWLRGWKV
jgi:hypothetical protein